MTHQRTLTLFATACALVLALSAGNAIAGDAKPGVSRAIIDALLAGVDAPAQPAAPLTLRGAVKAAVENNPGILAKAFVPESASQDVLAAAAAFEPSLTGSYSFQYRKTPVANRLDDLNPAAQAVEQSQSTFDFALGKLVGTGAQVELSTNNPRRKSSSANAIFNPDYRPSIDLGISQPLLRNFLAIDERTTILVAKQQSAKARAEFRTELADFVLTVVNDYWNRVLTEAELAVSRRSLELAEELVREAKKSAEVGVVPPVAVQQARAEAAAREEEVLRAENELHLAEKALQRSVMLGAGPRTEPVAVIPVDRHDAAVVQTDRATVLRTALENRPEVAAASYDVDRRKLDEKRTKNQKLPELNLVAGYGLDGLAGDPKADPDPGESQTTAFDGSYGDALKELAGGDFYHYRVGLEVQIPLGNAAARAEHTRAEIDLRRATQELHQTLSDVSLDVDQALADESSAFKRVSASRLSRELAAENLRIQQRRYELGAVTTKDVLDFQQKLSEATAGEARAITDHAIATADLLKAQGMLLASFDIVFEHDKSAEDLPLWTRF